MDLVSPALERIATLIKTAVEPVRLEVRHNDITNEFEVELRHIDGRWSQGSHEDLDKAFENSLKYVTEGWLK